MSWLERVNTDMVITCGDGKSYTPNWFTAEKSTQFNITEFEFVDIQGAFVDRREPKARRFTFSIVFQGENNIEDADEFERSSRDRRSWKISHPLFDRIVVHPTSLKFNNKNYNVTEITGTIVETLSRFFPSSVESPEDEIISKSEENTSDITSYANTELELSIEAVEANTAVYNEIKDQVPTEDGEAYFNLFTQANKAIFNASENPSNKLQALIDTQDYLLAPARFATSLRARIAIFQSQINALLNLLPSVVDKNQKELYEWQGSALVNGMMLSASSSTAADFTTANQTLVLAQILNNSFGLYVNQVDGFQTPNGAQPNSYSPNQSSFQSLTSLVNFTVSNLLGIALNGRQERTLLLYSDSDIINLTHRLYGLDESDDNIQELITQNGWGLNQYLVIPSNTEVIYYV